MNPFFFGASDRPLYGVHHPPKASTARSSGVVLCYPFAQEYMRAHRAFRQLSLLLSTQGFHTLRFDYTGTGDSSGDPADIALPRWDEDLDVAIEELIDTAAVDSVWVVGLRLGGSMALRTASRAAVKGVVLWDPIVSGEEVLADGTDARTTNGGSVFTIGGIPISTALRAELRSLDLLQAKVPDHLRCMLAVSADLPKYQRLRDRLAQQGAVVSYTCVPSDGRWSLFDNWGSALIPQELIRAIVDYLTKMEK